MPLTYRLKTLQVSPVSGNHNAYLSTLIIGSSTCIEANVATMKVQLAMPQKKSNPKKGIKWPDSTAEFDSQACYFDFLARVRGDKHFHIMPVKR